MAILTLLFAATISSTDIDEFFTLPSWMPTTVASKDTPGNDPASGENGWYVDEYTNVVTFTEFTTKNEAGFEVEYDQPTYYDGVWSAADPPSREIPEGYEYFSKGDFEGPEDVLSITWPIYLWCETNQSYLTKYYIASRSDIIESVRSGWYSPKSSRLTPDIQAGVLSTFAGYCERQYYASQGQSNSWDTATYGPTNNKKKFWFSPDDRTVVSIYTNWYWMAETSMGNYDTVSMSYYSRYPGPGWRLTGIGSEIASAHGYVYVDMNPRFASGTSEDTEVAGSSTLTYRNQGGSTDYSTNFTFRATKYYAVTTNDYHYYGSEFLYFPTNRTVTSRRLLQYENIRDLAEYLTDELGGRSFVHKASYRPGWFSRDDFYSDWPKVWWASTEGNVFTGTRIIPPMTNADRPTIAQMWVTCSQTLGCLKSDDVWHTWNDRTYFPGKVLMSSLSFGQSNYNEDNCVPADIDCYVNQLIETNFPHADGYAITNDTRRLVPDRLCCENQMLSLMDMTYAVPDVSYPSVGTNRNYHNEITCFGTASHDTVHLSGNYFTATFQQDPSIYSWDAYSPKNYCWENSMTSSGNSLNTRVTSTATSTSFKLDASGLYGVSVGQELLELALDRASSFSGSADFVATFSSGSGFSGTPQRANIGIAYSIDFTKNGSTWTVSGEVEVPAGAINGFTTYYFYGREYSYLYTLGYASLGITQPGWQGTSRVTESNVGTVLATHSRPISLLSLTDLSYSSTSSTCLYNSYEDAYSGRFGIVEKFCDVQDHLGERFEDEYGTDPNDWETIIPISQEDATDVRDSIRIQSCNVVATGTGWTTTYSGTYDADSHETTVSEVTSSKSGETVQGPVDLVMPEVQSEIEKIDPTQEERAPLAMDAKVGAITRVKWNWRTLKRTE